MPVALMVRVEVPPQPVTVTLLGLTDAVGPLFGIIVVVRLAVPVKPSIGAIVTVAEIELPLWTARIAGAKTSKSSTFTVTETVCDLVPLVAVTVTVYEPAGVELVVATVSVEVAEPPADNARLVGLSAAVGPEGDTVAARLTVPEKPYWLPRVSVDVEELPTLTLRFTGLADMP